jgi:integrase
MEHSGYKSGTIKQRINLLKRLNKPFSECSAQDVLQVVPISLSQQSRRVYVNALKVSFQDLVTLGVCKTNPVDNVRLGRTGPRSPRPLTPSQCDVLLSGRQNDAEYAFSVLGLYAGFRASDVVGLYPEDLEETYDGWVVHVDGKADKRASIPAHPLVVQVIKRLGERGPFFKMRTEDVSKRWSAWAMDLGLPKLRYHQCRHTFATRLYAHTGDLLLVRDAMRHSSVAATQVYAQMDNSKTSRAIAGL